MGWVLALAGCVNGSVSSNSPMAVDADEDGDGVPASADCDDSNAAVGALLYAETFDDPSEYLENTSSLTDPWAVGGGLARNWVGGQQALVGENESWTDTVTFATLRGEGLHVKCRNCAHAARPTPGDDGYSFVLSGLYEDGVATAILLNDDAVLRVNRDEGWVTLEGTASAEGGETFEVNLRWEIRGRGDAYAGDLGPDVQTDLQTEEVVAEWEYLDLVSGSLISDSTEILLSAGAERPAQLGWKANHHTVSYGLASGLTYEVDGRIGSGDMKLELLERDRFRAGILARMNHDADQGEGFHGYRCAVARNSQLGCYEPGRFVQLAAFLDGPEGAVQSECSLDRCAPNPGFDQLDREPRGESTDLILGDGADLTFWAVGNSLQCEFAGEDGERVVTSATDDRIQTGGTGLSVLNLFTQYESVRVCQAFHIPE